MKILVVDDDAQLASIIAFAMKREGWQVLTAADGRAALDAHEREQPDLVLLDINLPKLSGLEVLKRIRAESKTPVILLTVRADDEDVVHGLDLGADDYIAKPFSPKTLLARVRAVLRRAQSVPATGDLSTIDWKLDPDRQQVTRADQPPVHLTPLEFRLLQYLMVHRGQVLESDALVQHVWGYEETGDRILLKQLVRRLRVKIEADPANPVYIETVPNIGYSFQGN